MSTFIDGLFQRETLPVLESANGFAYQNQMTIMNNIANVDTPDYKRKTLPAGEFREKLVRAIEDRALNHPTEFKLDDGLNLRFDGNYPKVWMIHGAEAGPERHDNNSVVIEKEMSDLAKNQLYMTAVGRLYKKKLDMMRASLRDRVA